MSLTNLLKNNYIRSNISKLRLVITVQMLPLALILQQYC